MRICLIGCVEFSAQALRSLVSLASQGECELVGVVTRSNSSFNADFVDLGKCSELSQCQADVHYYNDEEEMSFFIRKLSPDVIYCFGWSKLLSPVLLNAAPKGVVGFHPAKLPSNRGRHPIIWALVLGLEKTASTFFIMDEGADSGPIISQRIICIDFEDNARTLYDKIVSEALLQIEDITRGLASDSVILSPQNEAAASYWRKRSASDGVIDWRMSAINIYNLVRALSTPYPGAEFYINQYSVKVWGASVFDAEVPQDIEPGKVLEKEGDKILVKCGGATALWLNATEPGLNIKVGEYL